MAHSRSNIDGARLRGKVTERFEGNLKTLTYVPGLHAVTTENLLLLYHSRDRGAVASQKGAQIREQASLMAAWSSSSFRNAEGCFEFQMCSARALSV